MMQAKMVRVTTMPRNKDYQVDEHTTIKCISWHDSSDRRWLMNHLHHCMMNEKQVTLIPLPESN